MKTLLIPVSLLAASILTNTSRLTTIFAEASGDSLLKDAFNLGGLGLLAIALFVLHRDSLNKFNTTLSEERTLFREELEKLRDTFEKQSDNNREVYNKNHIENIAAMSNFSNAIINMSKDIIKEGKDK